MQELVGVLSIDDCMLLLLAARVRLGWLGYLTITEARRIDVIMMSLGYVLEKAA